ncbi:uncharacterized protein LOC123875285 [Maniola jurtina]|uniref:uncharacterized protein LOC123875285 n=1 Tax=Maniola jurtina TaxID=191418 RepID=UPI001E687BB4|nr:uncharacterized protein LOC123875285 [Maniola jurtina]
MDVSAEVGTKMYRHILIAASHFTEDYKFTICLTVVMTLSTTVIYIGAAIVMEGPRTHKVLSYFIWREIRSLFSLWLLCSASYQTRIICDDLVKRLSERLVFELDSKDNSSRKLTKRWLKCVKMSPVRYLEGSCYTLSHALPLSVLDYSTNYLLIIVQMYPLFLKKSRRSQTLDSL